MFWARIQFKLGEGKFFLGMMRQALTPARNRPDLREAVATAPLGTNVVSVWQPRFYYYFDAFLAATRSLPDIIQVWQGLDPLALSSRAPKAVKSWVLQLSEDERARRQAFQNQFHSLYQKFRRHPMSQARNLVIHREGTPNIDVEVVGEWGTYQGGPTHYLPMVEIPPDVAARDPKAPVGPVLAIPLEPTPDNFFLRKVHPNGRVQRHPLFPTAENYLEVAYDLVGKADGIAAKVHGGQPLTPPS
jgi:hypothetical protein